MAGPIRSFYPPSTCSARTNGERQSARAQPNLPFRQASTNATPRLSNFRIGAGVWSLSGQSDTETEKKIRCQPSLESESHATPIHTSRPGQRCWRRPWTCRSRARTRLTTRRKPAPRQAAQHVQYSRKPRSTVALSTGPDWESVCTYQRLHQAQASSPGSRERQGGLHTESHTETLEPCRDLTSRWRACRLRD